MNMFLTALWLESEDGWFRRLIEILLSAQCSVHSDHAQCSHSVLSVTLSLTELSAQCSVLTQSSVLAHSLGAYSLP